MPDASEQVMEQYGAQLATKPPEDDDDEKPRLELLSSLKDILGNIDSMFSSSAPKMYSADSPSNYPTSEDAAAARRSGIGYGSPNEAFIEGQRERTVPPLRGRIDDQFSAALQKVNATDVPPAEKQRMADVYTKAQLVVNRSPISALGFDPRHIAVDTSGDKLTLGGVYLNKSDQVWAGISEPDAIVHESTHRGIEKLRQSGMLSDDEKNWLDTGEREELLVRHLMQKYAGTEAPQITANIPSNEVGRILNQRAADYAKNNLAQFNKYEKSIEEKAQQLYYKLYGGKRGA